MSEIPKKGKVAAPVNASPGLDFLSILLLLAKLQNTQQIICISLNKNSNYCCVPRFSKHTDTCKWWAGCSTIDLPLFSFKFYTRSQVQFIYLMTNPKKSVRDLHNLVYYMSRIPAIIVTHQFATSATYDPSTAYLCQQHLRISSLTHPLHPP